MTYILNRLSSDIVNDISYELWYNKSLTPVDLKALKPFDCIIHICIPKKRQKKRDKIDTRFNMSYFIEYIDTNIIHKIWNFERKKFERSYDLIFEETQFPKSNDFDESSVDSYNPQTLSSSSSPSLEFELTSESNDRSSRQVYNEIIIQLSSVL